jgi:ATP-dependent Clp protease ATP-binding subunit ClpA
MSGGQRYDKFTERAKKVLVLAQEEAQRFNHNYIGTEHLLLGLVREGSGVAARVLEGLGVELSKVRAAVLFRVGKGDRMVIGDISLTTRAKKAIELSVAEARGLHHNHVGTEHLLLGLVREGEGIAASVLESLGVSLEKVRRQIIQVISQEPEARSGRPLPRDNVVTFRVDDQTLNALDALVETGVHSTRSEAAARLLRSGMEANGPLLERAFAAVAEIRRVREEMQRLAQDIQEGENPEPPDEPKKPDEPDTPQGNPQGGSER